MIEYVQKNIQSGTIKLEAGETKTLSFDTQVIKNVSEKDEENNIKPTFDLNYTNGTEQKIEYSNVLQDGTLSVKITPNSEKDSYKKDDEIKFQALVKNESLSTAQNNIELKINVPDGMEFVTSNFSDMYKESYDTDRINNSVTYDKKTNTITCKFNDLDTNNTDLMIFTLKVSTSENKDIKFRGTLTSNIETNGVKSNEVEINTKKSGTTPESVHRGG